MEFLVITGLSGAGKTQAVHAFEDMGYYCIDNIPFNLLEHFLELCAQTQTDRKYCAVIDIRAVLAFGNLSRIKQRFAALSVLPKIIYLDAADEVLLRRYKETRRRHPMLDNDEITSLSEAVTAERLALHEAKAAADFVIDSSALSPTQLREKLFSLFATGASEQLHISVTSFGFKHLAPTDADLLFDVRCLPNPFYVEALRDRRGTDPDVAEYVFAAPEAKEFLHKILDLLLFSIPLYQKEGKSSLVVAIGCTGGHHRSVAFAEEIAARLREHYSGVTLQHRDVRR